MVNEFAANSQLDIHEEVAFNLLQGFVKGFGGNPVVARRAMRELLGRMPAKFYAAALQLLKSGETSSGHDYLISLLLEDDLLMTALSDPAAFSLETAIALAKTFYRLDPYLDVKFLSKIVQDSSMAPNLDALERTLEIVDAISDGKRLVPNLMKLQRHEDPRIRSKAVLLIVRAHRNLDWLQLQLGNPDPRLRANAVEGLLDTIPSPKEIQALWAAADDPHHRVATTALLVLWKNGQKGAAEKLLEAANHPLELFRAGAAWAMGKTDNPDFLATLQKMARADTGYAKRMALKSSVSIRKNVKTNIQPDAAESQELPPPEVTAYPKTEKSPPSDIDPGAVQSG